MGELIDLINVKDIRKLKLGDVVMAKFEIEEAFLVYDGKKNGLYQFLDYIGGEPHPVICHWRGNEKTLIVEDGYLSGFEPGNSLNQTYEPGDKDFEIKERIIKNSGVI